MRCFIISWTLGENDSFTASVCSCIPGFQLRIHFLSIYSLNVTLPHDATCVPSTCSDDDGHPERSSSIVPGEPTGQRGQYMLTPAPAHIYRCACALPTCLFGLKGESVLCIFKHAPVLNQQAQISHFYLCKYTFKTQIIIKK